MIIQHSDGTVKTGNKPNRSGFSMFRRNTDIGKAFSANLLLVRICQTFVAIILIEFLNEGILVVEWIKVHFNYPGDAVIDSNFKRLKAHGRGKYYFKLTNC